MEKKKSIFLIILLCILVAVAAGGSSYLVLAGAHDQETQALNDQADQLQSQLDKLQTEAKSTATTTATPTTTPAVTTVTPDPTASWKIYNHTPTGLNFRYPTDWSLREGSVQDPTDKGIWLTSPHKNSLGQEIVMNLGYPASEVIAKDKVISVSDFSVKGLSKKYYLVNAGGCCGGPNPNDSNSIQSYTVPFIILSELKPNIGLIPDLHLFVKNPKDSTETVQLYIFLTSTQASQNTTTWGQLQSHQDYQTLREILDTYSSS